MCPVFYNDFTAVSGIEGVSKKPQTAARSNQNAIQRVMTMLAEIFTPIIPAIIVGRIILGFRNVLEAVGMPSLGQQVADGVKVFDARWKPRLEHHHYGTPFWNGVNHFLWLPGEAIFHFLPEGITWSVSRKMGTTRVLEILYWVSVWFLHNCSMLTLFQVLMLQRLLVIRYGILGSFTINRIGYQAQVIAALLAGLSLSYLENFLA